MEQPDPRKRHGHAIFIADLDDVVVTDRTAWLGNVFNTALMGSFNVVSKGEEGVGAQGHILHLIQPCPLFFSCEYRRLLCKDLFPLAVCQYVHILVSDVNVDGIIPVGPFDLIDKRKV